MFNTSLICLLFVTLPCSEKDNIFLLVLATFYSQLTFLVKSERWIFQALSLDF